MNRIIFVVIFLPVLLSGCRHTRPAANIEHAGFADFFVELL